jgi:hypothetical protein
LILWSVVLLAVRTGVTVSPPLTEQAMASGYRSDRLLG